jgi:hypothetical protein
MVPTLQITASETRTQPVSVPLLSSQLCRSQEGISCNHTSARMGPDNGPQSDSSCWTSASMMACCHRPKQAGRSGSRRRAGPRRPVWPVRGIDTLVQPVIWLPLRECPTISSGWISRAGVGGPNRSWPTSSPSTRWRSRIAKTAATFPGSCTSIRSTGSSLSSSPSLRRLVPHPHSFSNELHRRFPLGFYTCRREVSRPAKPNLVLLVQYVGEDSSAPSRHQPAAPISVAPADSTVGPGERGW